MTAAGIPTPAPILVGIETEYGIAIRGAASFDPVAASLLLLSHHQPAAPAGGSPSGHLAADLMLPNGARFYLDHAHPEYATPECRGPGDLVAADRAGERILDRCRALIDLGGVLPAGQRLALYKNSSDGTGNSYGCHENYLVSPATWAAVVHGEPGEASFVPFLVTRTVLCGAGKVGAENATAPAGFQLCQRADFFETLRGVQTTCRRPLLNQRDEPHARHHQRLHVITGDANLAERSTWLKVGTTSLVLALIEAGRAPSAFRLRDPLGAHRAVSRDLTLRAPLELDSGWRATALEIQRAFLAAARALVDERPVLEALRPVLAAWDDALACLDDDWTRLGDRLDWAIKRLLLERILARHGATWDDVKAWWWAIDATAELSRPAELSGDVPEARLAAAIGQPRADRVCSDMRTAGLPWAEYWRRRDLHFALRRVDLDYHEIRRTGPAPALFTRLERANAVERVIEDDEITVRVEQPPPDTRAWVRGRLVEMLAPHLVSVDWSAVVISHPSLGDAQPYRIELADPFAGKSVQSEALLSSIRRRMTQAAPAAGHHLEGDHR